MLKSIPAVLFCLQALWAQPRVTTPLFPLKDGEADALAYSGVNKDLEVDGGGNPVIAWMTYQLNGVDRAGVDSAFLTLYVRTVTAPGTFQVFALSKAVSKPENSVGWGDIAYDTSVSYGKVSLAADSMEHVVAVNVTGPVKSGAFDGLALVSSDGLKATFGSKESPMKPFIMLTYKALQGPKGDSGARGLQGLQGLKGDTGDKGDKGDSGSAGPNAISPSTSISDSVIAYRHLKQDVTDSLREWIRREYGLLSSQYSWKIAGSAGITFGSADNISMAVSPTGAPYIASYEVGFGLSVKFFNGSTWVNVDGPTVPGPGAIRDPAMAISPGGMPYVVFGDYRNGWKATVMRYTGTAWEDVGTPGFSPDTVSYLSMAVSSAGVPYVFFRDGNVGKATVMRYSGSAWELVGARGFSTGGSGLQRSLVLNSADTPYVAFSDEASGYWATAMRFNGTAWENVGTPAFSGSSTAYISMAMGPSDLPYVAYADFFTAPTGRISVKRYVGGIWEQVGAARFTSGEGRYISLVFSASGRPYVGFKDMAMGGKASVMRLYGSGWETVGNPGFSADAVGFALSMTLTPDETPYVGFEDAATSSKATVMRFVK